MSITTIFTSRCWTRRTTARSASRFTASWWIPPETGAFLPSTFPAPRSWGTSGPPACAGAVYGEGLLADAYGHRKLLDRYLEPVALQQNLTLPEIRLLLCLSYSQQIDTRKGLADFAGISRSTLTILLQRLSLRELIRMEDVHPHRQEPAKRTAVPRRFKFAFLPAAQPVLEALEGAVNDYHAACFSGFSQEELVQYAFLADRSKRICKRLSSNSYPKRRILPRSLRGRRRIRRFCFYPEIFYCFFRNCSRSTLPHWMSRVGRTASRRTIPT